MLLPRLPTEDRTDVRNVSPENNNSCQDESGFSKMMGIHRRNQPYMGFLMFFYALVERERETYT